MDQVRKELMKLIENQVGTMSCFAGEVTEVNENNKTCTVLPVNGDPEFHNVRLTPAINDDATGVIMIPKKGSSVVCGKLTKNVAFVMVFGDLDKVLLRDMEIELNGSDNGGVVIIDKLKNNLDSLKDYCSALKTATATALVALDSLIPGTSAAFNATMAAQIILFEDMENKKVKHG